MLVELGLVEQRYQAVSEVLVDGVTVTEVALRLGVSRQTVHAWLRRYGNGGIGDLANRNALDPNWPGSIGSTGSGSSCRTGQTRNAA